MTLEDFKAVKGPDFISRLRGIVDLRGLNRSETDEANESLAKGNVIQEILKRTGAGRKRVPVLDQKPGLYMVRRALVLRQFLVEKARKLYDPTSGTIDIDDGVLNALLGVSEYRHGVRSLEALIDMSLLAERTTFEKAALPPMPQLELHVPAQNFMDIVVRKSWQAAETRKARQAAP